MAIWMALSLLGDLAVSATITVDVFVDEALTSFNGNCSLREAVQAANTNAAVDGCVAGDAGSRDVIQLAAGVYTITRAGADDTNQNGDLDTSASLHLVGVGETQTVIRNDAFDRLLHVTGGDLEVEALSIENGQLSLGSGRGACVRAAGALTLRHVHISGCRLNGASGGGFGAAVHAAGTLLIEDSTIADNRLFSFGSTNVAIDLFGGGVAAYGPTTIRRSRIVGNVIDGSNTDSMPNVFGQGGGLYVDGATTVLEDSEVSHNLVLARGGALPSANGGGIAVGAAGGSSGTLEMMRTTVAHNRAFAENGGGGGVFVSSGDTVRIVQSTLTYNRARTGGGALGSELTLDHATVAFNTATASGGGVSGSPVVFASIIAENIGPAGPDVGSGSSLQSRGYNLIGEIDLGDIDTTTGDNTDMGNVLNLPALLEASGALASGSPGRDGATCDSLVAGMALTSDANGTLLPVGVTCDIGAVEYQGTTRRSAQSAVSGGTCTGDGWRVESGVDIDDDGVLDASEADAGNTFTLCDTVCEAPPECPAQTECPAPVECPMPTACPEAPVAAKRLLSQTTEPAGDHCEHGGQRIDAGADQNGNGTLEAAEIDGSTYACSATPADKTPPKGGCRSTPISAWWPLALLALRKRRS